MSVDFEALASERRIREARLLEHIKQAYEEHGPPGPPPVEELLEAIMGEESVGDAVGCVSYVVREWLLGTSLL